MGRILIYSVISIVGGVIFAFSHDFGTPQFFSVYERYAHSGELWPALGNAAFFASIIFVALLLLFGWKKKK